ncbi:peptidoglycan-binding domain-containing protein [Streptomyces sp. BE147]|uniref:peptidoglycan-binding domain-containing protein n=1 Tax=Streptomyces sp. BE147 TaxID=3002524 RepID=UPI003FA7B5DF
MALLQRRPRRQGFNPGPISGIFGPGTTVALKEFQTTGAPEIIVDGICGSQMWPFMG